MLNCEWLMENRVGAAKRYVAVPAGHEYYLQLGPGGADLADQLRTSAGFETNVGKQHAQRRCCVYDFCRTPDVVASHCSMTHMIESRNCEFLHQYIVVNNQHNWRLI